MPHPVGRGPAGPAQYRAAIVAAVGDAEVALQAVAAESRSRQAQASGKITRESFITGTESIGSQVISGFPVSFSATSHAASKFVEMSMLTGDGRVRT